MSTISTNPTDLRRVALSVILPLHPSDAPPPDGNLLRRGLLASIRERDPDLVQLLHDDPGPAGHPWTVGDAFACSGRWWFRTTAIGTEPTLALGRALRPGGLAAVRGWRLGPTRDWRARAVRAPELIQVGCELRNGAVVSLLSPSVFSAPNAREPTPIPTSWSIVGGWWRRWRAHVGAASLPAGCPVDQDAARTWIAGRVVIADHQLMLERAQSTRDIDEVASQGAVLLRFVGDERDREALAALARFGAFAGSGRKLAHGFGQTATGLRPIGWPDLLTAHYPVRSAATRRAAGQSAVRPAG